MHFGRWQSLVFVICNKNFRAPIDSASCKCFIEATMSNICLIKTSFWGHKQFTQTYICTCTKIIQILRQIQRPTKYLHENVCIKKSGDVVNRKTRCDFFAPKNKSRLGSKDPSKKRMPTFAATGIYKQAKTAWDVWIVNAGKKHFSTSFRPVCSRSWRHLCSSQRANGVAFDLIRLSFTH